MPGTELRVGDQVKHRDPAVYGPGTRGVVKEVHDGVPAGCSFEEDCWYIRIEYMPGCEIWVRADQYGKV